MTLNQSLDSFLALLKSVFFFLLTSHTESDEVVHPPLLSLTLSTDLLLRIPGMFFKAIPSDLDAIPVGASHDKLNRNRPPKGSS